jgi:hypothetical protein
VLVFLLACTPALCSKRGGGWGGGWGLGVLRWLLLGDVCTTLCCPWNGQLRSGRGDVNGVEEGPKSCSRRMQRGHHTHPCW